MRAKLLKSWAVSIEAEAEQQILQGIPQKDNEKKYIQGVARDIFKNEFSVNGSICGEGVFIVKHVLIGSLRATDKLQWAEEKAIRHVCIGLLKSMCDSDKNFSHCAAMLTRGSIQAALAIDYNVSVMTEDVVDVILKVGKTKKYSSPELLKVIARSAVSAASYFPGKETTRMKDMLFSLVDRKVSSSTVPPTL